MVNFLQFPAVLFYGGSGENGYERYMKDDPTGINHVLDTMYGAVFNLKGADFDQADPAFYMDAAYRLAIAIKLQRYPHRFLRMSDVDGFLTNFAEEELWLSFWMAYALLSLRDDNSTDLEEFLKQFRAYLLETDPFSLIDQINIKLQAIVMREEENGKVYNAILNPQPPEAETIRELRYDDARLVVKNKGLEFLLAHVVKYDVQRQQALLYSMQINEVFKGNFDVCSQRIDNGDFITFDEEFHPELPEASEEEQYVMRMKYVNEMNLWKKKAEYYKAQCDCYEQKEKLAAVLDGAVQLGKGINTHLEVMYEELKKGAEEQNEALNAKIKELEKELKEAKAEKAQLEETLAETLAGKQNEANGARVEGTKIPELLNELINSIIDPVCISQEQYPGAKKLLEIAIDTKHVDEVLDSQAEKKLSRNLRKVDSLRQQNEERCLNQKALKQLQLSSIQSAQKVTIINGNKVERSYGDNYNLEAGANVVPQPSLQHPQLDRQQKPQRILNSVSSQ